MIGIFLGAFLGPFGGNVVQVLVPVLQRWYGVDVTAAAFSLTAYMVPFAAGQFVSGALADRFGRRPVLVAGFGGFALASLGCALAPTFSAFLVARAGQGLANACTTPILMAALGDVVAAAQLGRALGWFNAANTAGLFLAPLVAGTLATRDWRLVFAVLTVLAAGLTAFYSGSNAATSSTRAATSTTAQSVRSQFQLSSRAQRGTRRLGHEPLPDGTRPASDGGRGLMEVVTWRLAALCVCAFLGYLSLNGVGFVVVLFATATFGLDSARSGLLLSAFGLANMLSAAPAGVLVDRLGSARVSGAGALGAALVLSLLPFAPHPAVIGALLLAGGASTAALWAGLSKAAVQAAPSRRATASSLFNAWKFVGYAVAPLAYAPLYTHAGARVTFGVAAGAGLLILLPLASLRRSTASPTASWGPQATLPRPSNVT